VFNGGDGGVSSLGACRGGRTLRIDRPGTLGEVERLLLDDDADDEIDEGVTSPVWPGGRRVEA
jgi:hypothetical protein